MANDRPNEAPPADVPTYAPRNIWLDTTERRSDAITARHQLPGVPSGLRCPPCLTALAAPDRRQFIGDGSFQLTAQELSTILRHRLKPVILLINNQGYTIERLILGETSSYNDIGEGQYAQLSSVLDPSSRASAFVVASMAELEQALEAAANPSELTFIEVKFERMAQRHGRVRPDGPRVRLRQLGRRAMTLSKADRVHGNRQHRGSSSQIEGEGSENLLRLTRWRRGERNNA